MTIEYMETSAIITPRVITFKDFIKNRYGEGGTIVKTKATLTPGETAAEDNVVFEVKGKEKRVIRGMQIKIDHECQQRRIGWNDPLKKPELPRFSLY